MHHHRNRLAASLCGLTVVAATGLLTTRPASAQSTTTATVAPARTSTLTYAARGTYDVGSRVFTTTGAQQRRLTLRAWYPARRTADQATTKINYSAPNKFDRQTLPAKQITSTGSARSNAEPERNGGPYPLVVFSHGYAMSPIMFTTLVEHYASQGFVVLAPEHNETFDQSLSGFWKAIIDRPVDVRRTIDEAQRLNKPRAALAGMIDLGKVAVVGHSYGGYTALAAGGARFDFAAYKARCAPVKADDPLNLFCGPIVAKEAEMATRAGLRSVPSGLWPSLGDPRVKAVISMAGDAYLFDRRGLAELKVPVMVLGGTVDDGTPYTWGAKLTYDDAASSNKTLVTFPGAGHMLFVDSCDNFSWATSFAYRDAFCTDAVWGARRPLDVVMHYTTAFLRETLDADANARATLTGTQPRLDDVEYATSRKP